VIAYAARQDLFPLRIGERRRLVQVRFHAGTRNQAPFAARLALHFSPVIGKTVRFSLWNHPGDTIYGMFAHCESSLEHQAAKH